MTSKSKLLDILEHLTSEHLKKFTWYLREKKCRVRTILKGQLENKSCPEILDKMFEFYNNEEKVVKEFKFILKKIPRMDLIERFPIGTGRSKTTFTESI